MSIPFKAIKLDTYFTIKRLYSSPSVGKAKIEVNVNLLFNS